MAGIRRTWDKALYEAKAKDRLERGDGDVEQRSAQSTTKSSGSKEEFKRAEDDADGPLGSDRAFLKAREGKVDLESKVGKVEVIKPNTTEHAAGPGFHCEVCDCLLKDSASYLDHINGKKHQRALGFSMRVERANVDKVKERLGLLKKTIIDKDTTPVLSAGDAYERKLALQVAEEEIQKRRKKEEALAKKREREEAEMEDIDPEIAALMGFGSFTKKK